MASVFLSYDHEDAACAAPIAAALEDAGHSVWWDRHIHGGAEYNSEIEGAVARADVVVVLWTERSVRSAWVRDEAAEGRDRAKLVPVTLDGAKPPMGFRQYQTIALAGAKGRRLAPQLGELMRAIDMIAGSARISEPKASAASARPKPRSFPLTRSAAVIAIAALLVGGLLLWRPWASSLQSVVAISAADASQESQNYARDLLAQLGQLQSARPDTLRLVDAGAGKRASLVFEVSGATPGEQARANVVLLDGRTNGLIWSKAFARPIEEAGDLRQELGYSVGRVLECAVEAHPGGRSALKPESLKLYLNGCADLADARFAGRSDLISVFRRVITTAPNFAGAWAKLLSVEDDAYVGGQERLKADLQRDIAAARKLNPEMAEAYLAEADLLPLDAFSQKLSLVDRAVASNPGNSASLTYRSASLFAVGRVSGALDDAKQAAALNPISPRVRNNYILALAQAGRTQAALDEIARAERIWPGSSAISDARFAIHLRFGDPRIAWQMIESGETDSGWVGAKSFIDARINPTPANVERAIRDARAAGSAQDLYVFQHLVQTMSIFHREDELLSLLLTAPIEQAIFVTDVTFRPAARELWRNPKSLEYAKRVGLLQYWRSSGKWPDFCFEGDLPYDCRKEAARLLA